jgi:hypothetical protein
VAGRASEMWPAPEQLPTEYRPEDGVRPLNYLASARGAALITYNVTNMKCGSLNSCTTVESQGYALESHYSPCTNTPGLPPDCLFSAAAINRSDRLTAD